MPASSVAQILLRLFALGWGLKAVIGLVSIGLNARPGEVSAFWFLSPGIYLVAAVACWQLSPAIARAVAKGMDGPLSLQGVTQPQLFACTLLGVGAYFALFSVGELINWTHFFAIRNSPQYGFHRGHEPSYYDLTEAAITFAAGVGLVLTAKIWAEKLSHPNLRQSEPERPAPPQVDL